MSDNSVGCSTKVTTQTVHKPAPPAPPAPAPAPPHQQKDASFGKKLDESWRHLLCLLRPPLQQIFANCPTSSTPRPVEPKRPRRHKSLQPCDSERSDRGHRATPTPFSSQVAGPSSPAHPTTREAVRAGKRRLESEAAGEAVPVHKKTETSDHSSSTAEYKLILVQEPTTGAAFEDNLLGRIGLAPPLILELQVLKGGKVEDVSAELPFLICQCSLLDDSGAVADVVDQSSIAAGNPLPNTSLVPPTPPTRGRRGRTSSSRRGTSASAVSTRSSESAEASTSAVSEDTPAAIDAAPAAASQQARSSFSVPPPSSGRDSPPRLARMLYGTIVAGPQQYDSLQDEENPYFFFPEISVRTPGKFKIQCKLMRLSLPGMPTAEQGILASIETQIFEVVKRDDYMAPYITDISRHFARQGVPLLLPPGVSAD